MKRQDAHRVFIDDGGKVKKVLAILVLLPVMILGVFVLFSLYSSYPILMESLRNPVSSFDSTTPATDWERLNQDVEDLHDLQERLQKMNRQRVMEEDAVEV